MSKNYRTIVTNWLRDKPFNMSDDQVDCAVHLLQTRATDIPHHCVDIVLFAYYTGLKHERERSVINASTHRLA